MKAPDLVTTDSIVTAAQWGELAEYMRWVYNSLPATTLTMCCYPYTGSSATARFPSGTTIYYRSSGTCSMLSLPVMVKSSASSGFNNYGYATYAVANQTPVVRAYKRTQTSVLMPSSTAYFGTSYQTAVTVTYEGTWMEDV